MSNATPSETDENLPVAETFYSVQGEGPYAGTPAVFLRLGGCNLLCGDPDDPDAPQEEMEASDGATWLCDTIETWRNAESQSFDQILNHWSARSWLSSIRNGQTHLVVTGGEPLLHQDRITDFLTTACAYTVEIETNGTIVPTDRLDPMIDQYNVSLKLSNSGMDADRRLNDEAIEIFAEHERATFKFVVSRDADIEEIDALAEDYEIPARKIMLMPAGATRSDLADTYPEVAELCLKKGYRFSPRHQVTLWNQATGV